MKNILRHSAILALSGLIFFPSLLQGQKITRQKDTRTTYSVSAMGYPSAMVPMPEGGIAYVEWATEGNNRRAANYYLVHLNKGFEEEWAKPVTREGAARMNVSDVYRMKNGIAVVGFQYNATIKRQSVKMQVFGLNGGEKGGLQTLDEYTKKDKKGFVDELMLSPDKTKLMWLGHNPQASAKKRKQYVSVWTDEGRKLWSSSIYIPVMEEGYFIKQALCDNRGHAYFLLNYETYSNTEKDTAHLPVIIRYDYREKKLTDYQVKAPGASIAESYIQLTQDGDLVFFAIEGGGASGGIMNGAKVFGNPMRWNSILYKRFEVERELHLSQEYRLEIPESWISKYGENGSNFSRGEVLEHDGRLYWVLEENYTQTHNNQLQHLFYDIAVVAIEGKTGEILWASSFEKKQRDYESSRLLSYVPGFASGKLHFVYLNERGAQGKIMASSFDLDDGSVKHTDLVRNERADYLFFPRRSGMIDENRMMLMGVGNPVGNDYRLIEITF